jgi:hypothetical protein
MYAVGVLRRVPASVAVAVSASMFGEHRVVSVFVSPGHLCADVLNMLACPLYLTYPHVVLAVAPLSHRIASHRIASHRRCLRGATAPAVDWAMDPRQTPSAQCASTRSPPIPASRTPR